MQLQVCISGVEVTKQISSILLISLFFQFRQNTQLRWHLSNINRFKESNKYFCKIQKFPYGEINERSFSNTHPCKVHHNNKKPSYQYK